MKLILLGAPGAGKGTQAQVICSRFSIPAISTGNCLREAVAAGTAMGKAAKGYMDRGELVPDEVVIGIIRDRLQGEDCKNGFILDGFPRTVPQAEALEAMGVAIDRVLEIFVPDETIVGRMSGRRVCPACGASYHTEFKPSKAEGVCDVCGKELIVRKDDRPETVTERLRVYHDQTEPLKGFYESRGLLTVVKGQQEVADTTRLVLEALEA
ncbi:MAG: adenylate kinase [Provencibacterium sp.]|jgi:adenylate kinase|nr:adenylate kinase [Provencibacterium sp.]